MSERKKVVMTAPMTGKCCWNLAGVFLAGLVSGIQMSLIFPNNAAQGSWWKVAVSVSLGIFFAYQSYITRVSMIEVVFKDDTHDVRREP